ncbi:hypothetical protein ACH4UM_14405 [Streptomyces sp. NPDC020801]|uniref:hypothetical protein n=1 Tax=unclassified Streptomyces TaxID=2593676 RepID=UPI0037AC2AEB
MSTASHARRAARRSACLRVLVPLFVLPLALLVPGVHAEAHAAPVTVMAGQAGGTSAEQDVLDAGLRPPARDGRRAVVPPRPAPLSDPAPAPAGRQAAAPAQCAPHGRHTLRSMVLRC